jgi:hypothetical protein
MASEDRTQDYNDDLKRMSEKLGVPTPPAIETPQNKPSQIEAIFTGWGNKIKDVFGQLDPETKALGESRLLTCNSCHIRTGNSCDTRKSGIHAITGLKEHGCGCNISAKTLYPQAECPVGKW